MLAYLLILLANIYFFVASVYNVKSSGYRNKRLAAQVVIDVITRITALLLCYC